MNSTLCTLQSVSQEANVSWENSSGDILMVHEVIAALRQTFLTAIYIYIYVMCSKLKQEPNVTKCDQL